MVSFHVNANTKRRLLVYASMTVGLVPVVAFSFLIFYPQVDSFVAPTETLQAVETMYEYRE